MSTCSASDAWLFGYQLREGLGWGCRASWVNWPEREGGIDPWSLTWKTGEAGSFHSSSSPLAGPVHPINPPPCQDAHNIQEQVHKQGAFSFS